ncbi:Calcium binding protein [Perkinsus olseni]|uniref:Calmodulin n=1 Tax=Perkinsus olseni TaxID=32597 RepID=A0A7J6NET9_PEROL|nr:Calcium binding protein [Perkinsus olseni]
MSCRSESSNDNRRDSILSADSDRKDTPEYNADPELIELAERMNLPAQDLEEFREVFSLVDIDRGGSISTEELGTLMETLGVKVTPDELEAMVADVDENGNGEIDFEEFVQVMSRKTSGDHSPEEVKAAFKLFAGPDGPDGTITLKDLQHALMVSFSEVPTRTRFVSPEPR